ncbi:testis-expressed protein 47-like isoform X3 [Scleropages formosus]|nr:testis-expressed protein 47-like isoform X3 [Scleropages formosus]
MVYVATKRGRRTTDDRTTSITEYYEQFISKFQKNPQTEGVTGTLLLYPNCFIHSLECSFDVLVEILKDLSEMESSPDSFLKDVKILVISYCLPRRMFHTWMYRSFNLPSSLQDASPQTQPVELLVTDCLSILYKLCTQLMSRKDTCPKPEEPERIMLVEEETIMYLCRSTTLLSPSDFLKGYAKPVDILMDSGNYQIVVCILIVAQQSVVALKIVFIFRNSVAHSTSTLLVASTEDRSGSHTVLLALV